MSSDQTSCHYPSSTLLTAVVQSAFETIMSINTTPWMYFTPPLSLYTCT